MRKLWRVIALVWFSRALAASSPAARKAPEIVSGTPEEARRLERLEALRASTLSDASRVTLGEVPHWVEFLNVSETLLARPDWSPKARAAAVRLASQFCDRALDRSRRLVVPKNGQAGAIQEALDGVRARLSACADRL